MNIDITKKKLREFGIILGFTFPILIGFILPSIYGHGFRIWTIYVGIPLLVLGIFKPYFLTYIYKFWMYLGFILGWVNSRIILGLIFVLIVIPISVLMRIFGYDPLRNKFNNQDSYREKKDNMTDLTKIF